MEKKVRKLKLKKPLDKRHKDVRMGAPPLDERELTTEQKKFAYMVGKGIAINIAQKECCFSDYQRKTYLELPQMQKEIEHYRGIFGQEDVDRVKAGLDEIEKATVACIIRKLDSDETPSVGLMKLLHMQLQRVALIETSPTIESTKVTEKIKKRLTGTNKPAAIPFDEEVPEAELIEERSIEETKETKE